MYKKSVFIFLLVTILCVPAAALAEDTTSLLLQGPPERRLFYVNESFTVELQIKGGLDVYGVEGHLTFDPAILEVVDMDAKTDGTQVKAGSFIDPATDEVFVLQNQADNVQGTIDYALALRNPAPAVSGDGLLMSITFRPKMGGETNITIADSLLVSSEVTKIDHSTQPLSVTIAEPGVVVVGNQESTAESPYQTVGLIIVGGFLLILSCIIALFVFLKRQTKQTVDE